MGVDRAAAFLTLSIFCRRTIGPGATRRKGKGETMTDEKNASARTLYQKAIEFREEERKLQLELEDRVAQLCQWAVSVTPDQEARMLRQAVDGDPAELFEELRLAAASIRTEVAPILAKLRELRSPVPSRQTLRGVDSLGRAIVAGPAELVFTGGDK